MLDPWSLRQKPYRKRLYRWLVEDRNIASASALHFTGEEEAARAGVGGTNAVILADM
jgi:hypothetical protein